MKFICPTCSQELEHELKVIISHTEQHIIAAVKKQHPEWVETNGICQKCYAYYKQQLHP